MATEPAAVGSRRAVAPLCRAAVLLDGFDLLVLGTLIPVLLKDKVFGHGATWRRCRRIKEY